MDQAFALIRQAADNLAERSGDQFRVRCEPAAGRAPGWAEAPQGEVLYDVALAGGRVVRCHPRSASFHNPVLMHEVFAGDILTEPYLYRPATRSFLAVVAVAKRLQSGRLDAYLLYMLIALVAVIAVVTVLA